METIVNVIDSRIQDGDKVGMNWALEMAHYSSSTRRLIKSPKGHDHVHHGS